MWDGPFIPCIGGVVFFALLFAFLGFVRWLHYRETLALAEKGLVRPSSKSSDGKDVLRWGIVITAIGLALTVGLWPLGLMGNGASQFPLGLGPWMLAGFIPTFCGLGLILVYILTRPEKPKGES